MSNPNKSSSGWLIRKKKVETPTGSVPHYSFEKDTAMALPPVLKLVIDLLRNDVDNWKAFVTREGHPVDDVLTHGPSGICVNLGAHYHPTIFVPGVGNLVYKIFENDEQRKEIVLLISEMGQQIREIRALEYLSKYEESTQVTN